MMKQSERRMRAQVYRSVEAFERRFLPDSFRKRVLESMDSRTLAASLADRSLKRVKSRLVRRRHRQ